MKIVSLIFLIGYCSLSFAASSGYIHQGKTVYLYKDGAIVEQKPDFENKPSRGPASVGSGMILFFTEDEVARCYYWAPKAGKKPNKNIHCLKKSELK